MPIAYGAGAISGWLNVRCNSRRHLVWTIRTNNVTSLDLWATISNRNSALYAISQLHRKVHYI